MNNRPVARYLTGTVESISTVAIDTGTVVGSHCVGTCGISVTLCSSFFTFISICRRKRINLYDGEMLHNTPSMAVLTHIHYWETAEGSILLRFIETVILRLKQKRITNLYDGEMLHNTPSVAMLTRIHYWGTAEGSILLRFIETVILRIKQKRILET